MTSGILDDYNVYDSPGGMISFDREFMSSFINFMPEIRRESLSPRSIPNYRQPQKIFAKLDREVKEDKDATQTTTELDSDQPEVREASQTLDREHDEDEGVKELKSNGQKVEPEKGGETPSKDDENSKKDKLPEPETEQELQKDNQTKAPEPVEPETAITQSVPLQNLAQSERIIFGHNANSGATIEAGSFGHISGDGQSQSTIGPGQSTTPVKVPLYIIESARDLYAEEKLTIEQVKENLTNEGHSQKIVDAVVEVLANETS